MSDFKTRLETEESELTEKITKLKEFLDGKVVETIDKDQRTLLGIQLQAMKTYRTCLKERLIRL
jgi:hypothetical protein